MSDELKKKSISVLIIGCLYFIIFISCSSIDKKEERSKDTVYPINWKVIEIEGIRLTVPASFIINKMQGVDSYVGTIGDNDFKISYDIGRDLAFSLQNTDCSFDSIVKREKENLKHLTSVSHLAIPNKNNAYLDTINGNIAKIIVPNKIGEGYTYICILNCKSSIWISLSADDLTPIQHKIALEIFESIEL